ncbi:ankyrin-1-like [Haliotis asinina]|uniref:ankyrin-1-like n=1 Tax=Haliotis asinina TaxID=109174 RepID=UPI0035326FDF
MACSRRVITKKGVTHRRLRFAEPVKTSETLKYVLLVMIIVSVFQGKGDECPLGTYGETCNKTCRINCAPSSDKKVHCHKLTGKCSERCNNGWHGDQCNIPCSRNCLNNVCNVQTGTCVDCKANYSGEYCETYKDSDGEDATTRLTYKESNNTGAEVGPFQHQDTDLHDACKEGNLQRVRDILQQNKNDIDKHGKDGMTPVMWAARRGHREILDLLVEKGANLQLVDDVRNNILHWACRGGNISMVKHIISINAVDISSKGRDGRTPLMYAARMGEHKLFQLLVSKGGLPAEVDNDGNSILQLACWGGNVEMVEYILLHNAVGISCTGQSRRTPLTAAAYKGHGQILDLLKSKGADLNAADDVGDSVLHRACLGGHEDIVSCVLKMDDVDINSRGQCGRSPLMVAARIGDKEIFDLLVEGGADAKLVDDDGNTILHLASKGGNVDIVKYVLSLEIVDINARNKHQETPTMMAARGSEVCDLLVSYRGLCQ